MRIPQPIGEKGSLKWIQFLVNENSEILNKKIQDHIKEELTQIDWVSPKKEDEFTEYRDGDFLKILGIEGHLTKLSHFWPNSGPQWDALGKFENKYHFIVEAKANIPEILSSCKAKSETSKKQIEKSVENTKHFLNVTPEKNWLTNFYQYANRIYHLYFLREVCGVNAYLIFIYFCNDSTHSPTSHEQWEGALKLQKNLMSLNRHKLQQYVIDIFIDINELKSNKSINQTA
ncbi:MAG: hypothetical protein KKD63_08145 [Proteobacteria bacterium]|nr:hypothetical protein [Desulfobulbaceae bacterium]MBU4152835.1 hypothetical protein [Pseudomonadota bacterium]